MPILTAKVGNSADLFPDILQMHVEPGSRIADVTYGAGAFWKKVDPSLYHLYPFDIEPRQPGVLRFNLLQDTLQRFFFDAAVFDPPFGNGSTSPRRDGLERPYCISAVRTPVGIRNFYCNGMMALQRFVKEKGIVIIKCQDMVNSGVQHRFTNIVFNIAMELGWKDLDRFTLVNPRIPQMRHKHQLHARKNESCFWVFRKHEELGT